MCSGPGLPSCLPWMTPLYTQGAAESRNFLRRTIVQLRRPSPQPALTCNHGAGGRCHGESPRLGLELHDADPRGDYDRRRSDTPAASVPATSSVMTQATIRRATVCHRIASKPPRRAAPMKLALDQLALIRVERLELAPDTLVDVLQTELGKLWRDARVEKDRVAFAHSLAGALVGESTDHGRWYTRVRARRPAPGRSPRPETSADRSAGRSPA